MSEQWRALESILMVEDRDPGSSASNGQASQTSIQQIHALRVSRNNGALIQIITDHSKDDLYRVYAATCLVPGTITQAQLKPLGFLLQSSDSVALRLALADTLSEVRYAEALDILLRSLVNSRDPLVRAGLARAVQGSIAPLDWRRKIGRLLTILQSADYFPDNLHANALVAALQPSQAELRINRHCLTDELLALASSDDPYIIRVVSSLVLESCNHDRELALSRIGQRPPTTQARAKIDAALTAEIAGSARRAQAEQLVRASQAHQAQVLDVWQRNSATTRHAAETRSSVALLSALAGLGMTGLAIWQFINGAAIEIVIGLGAIAVALFVIAGLVAHGTKQSRESLAESRAAEAVYASYLQRMAAIGIAQASYHTENGFTAKSLKSWDKLAGDVTKATVAALADTGPASLDEYIDRLIK